MSDEATINPAATPHAAAIDIVELTLEQAIELLDAKIAKARALGERWQKSELLLIALGATVGVPPQVLIAMLAGTIGIRFRTFVAIDVPGRIARFATIVVLARLI